MGLVVTKLGFFDFLEENVKFVGITLLITALCLYLIRNIKGKKEKKDVSFVDALVVGLFQVVALVPGISRSGAIACKICYDIHRLCNYWKNR